ncbi:MAG: alkaline phosphatase family protein, partial [Promethearchaeota archaeon]
MGKVIYQVIKSWKNQFLVNIIYEVFLYPSLLLSFMKLREDENFLICFLIDQVTPDVFFNYIDDGSLPNVLKYIVGKKKNGNVRENCVTSSSIVTSFPSTSANCHVTLLTGCDAGRTHILDTCFWIFDDGKPEFRDTGKITFSLLKDMNEKFINREVKTIFEHSTNSASFHAINRGAKVKLLNTRSLITKFLPLFLKLKKKKTDPSVASPFGSPEFWKKIFKDNLGKYLLNVKKSGNMPEITFIVFLLTDENGHKFGFKSHQYLEALQVFDFFVKSLVEGFSLDGEQEGENDNEPSKGRKKHVPGLKELNLMDRVTWCTCTDHASRPVFNEKQVFINSIVEWALGLRLLEGKEEQINKSLEKLGGDFTRINAFTQVDGELWLCWFGEGRRDPGTNQLDFSKFHGEGYFRNLCPKNKMRSLDLKKQEKKLTTEFANSENGKSRKEQSIKNVDLIDYLINLDSTQLVIIPEPDEGRSVMLDKFGKKQDYHLKLFSARGKSIVKRRKVTTNVDEYMY